jgi:radical SAM superfamily enzyme YgiQ (UPF0313 family)
MKYDVILFTDLAARFWHSKPLGAYRLATELRLHEYSTKVIDYTSFLFQDPKLLFKILKGLVGANTVLIGFSSSFFGWNYDNSSSNYKLSKIRNILDQFPSLLPCHEAKFDLICRQIKKSYPHVKLAFGGTNVHNNVTLNDCIDYVVLGLADKSIIDLVDHLKHGKSLRFNFAANGQKYKIIDHDVKGLSFNFVDSYTKYLPQDHVRNGEVLALETSRGCMFKCKFCSFPLLGRKKTDPGYHKHRSVLAEELRNNWEQYQVNKYFFIDDTFNETTGKIETLLEARDQAGVDIEFFSYLRIDLLEKFPEQIPLLRNLGLRSAFFGIETLHDASARAIGKGLSSSRVKDTLYKCRSMWGDESAIHTNFIAGLPHETPDTLNQWMEWAIDQSPADSIVLGPLFIPVQNLVWPSEFTTNYQQYGYKILENNSWANDTWNLDQVKDICNQYMTTLYESKRLKLGNWEIMGLQNYGYSYKELKNLPYADLNFKELESRLKKMISDYYGDLLLFENINV